MNDSNGFHEELESLAQELRDAHLKIQELENEVKKLKVKETQLQQEIIPDVMFQHGLTAVTLTGGERIEVKPFYYARIPKDGKGETDTDRANKFYTWLDNNGFGGLVKNHFEVWTTDVETVGYLRLITTPDISGFEDHIPYELSRGIHWKTLESWFKEQTEKQVKLPTDLFDSYVGRKATLK